MTRAVARAFDGYDLPPIKYQLVGSAIVGQPESSMLSAAMLPSPS